MILIDFWNSQTILYYVKYSIQTFLNLINLIHDMTNSQIIIYHTFNTLSRIQSIDSYNKEGDTCNDIKCDI